MAGLLLLAVGAGAALAGIAWALLRPRAPSDDDIFRRFDGIRGFTVTERHAHDGSGLAADETQGLVAVLGKGRETMALLRARELLNWHYLPKDGAFELVLRTRRHPEPFLVSFRRSATADEWLKIFRMMKEEHP